MHYIPQFKIFFNIFITSYSLLIIPCFIIIIIIHLKNIKVNTKIGVWAWEKVVSQNITIDMEFAIDTSISSKTDKLSDTKDYSQIVSKIECYIQASDLKLLEALAVNLANKLKEEFSLQWIRLKINKIGIIPNVSEIGITVERGQN